MRRSYCANGTNFRLSVSNPESIFRKVYEMVSEFGHVTRLEYFQKNNLRGLVFGNSNRVRAGYNSQIWSGLVNCGLIKRTTMKKNGYWVYTHGDNWLYWDTLVKMNELLEEF